MAKQLKDIVAASAMCMAFSVQASTGVSCLLAVQTSDEYRQPIGHVIVKASVLQVKNNIKGRNDFDCKALFEKTKSIWLNVSAKNFRDKPEGFAKGRKMWVSFMYGDDRGGAVWSDYMVITQQQYLEK